MKQPILMIVAAAFLAWCGTSDLKAGNLILNGSFESNVQAPGTWSLYQNGQVPGWTSSGADDVIEIDSSGVFGTAYDGNNSMEVDANHFQTVSQTITGLTPGAQYILSYMYGDRPGSGAQQLKVYFGATNVATNTGTGTGSNLVWTPNTFIVTADGISETLSFVGMPVGPLPSFGNEIDAVSLTSSVPEPSTLALLGAGLLGMLGVARRARRKSKTV